MITLRNDKSAGMTKPEPEPLKAIGQPIIINPIAPEPIKQTEQPVYTRRHSEHKPAMQMTLF